MQHNYQFRQKTLEQVYKHNNQKRNPKQGFRYAFRTVDPIKSGRPQWIPTHRTKNNISI